MDTIKIRNKKDTRIIAHRGVSGLEQENTYNSFFNAGFRSYFGIETDIHVTKDNKFIVCHDDNIKRVSGIDKIIEESTFDELRNIALLDKNGKTNTMSRLPSLEEYINICKAFNKYAILELKGEMSEEILYSIYEIINNLKYLTKVIFISFHKNNLIKLKDIYEEGNYQYLSDIDTDELKSDALNTANEYNFDLDVYHNFLTLDFIKKCKENNIKINVYTVNSFERATELIELGIDIITSNILE